jgi:hypothetical protein
MEFAVHLQEELDSAFASLEELDSAFASLSDSLNDLPYMVI